MDEWPFVTIIVLNYNGRQFLRECFSSLEMLDYPKDKYEIILVDNNSSDDSTEYVKKKFPWVRIIANKRNLGFSAGNNVAIRKTNASHVVTLNNDTKVTSNWLKELVKEADKDSRIGMVSGKTLFMHNHDIIHVKSILLCRSGRSIEVGFGEKNTDDNTVEDKIFGPCAVAALYKKDMLDEINGFDEDFFAYYEDVDLAWRAQLAGWKARYCPKAIVYHFHSGSWVYGSSRQRYFCIRNRLWTVTKNWPIRYIISYSIWIISIHILSALWLVAKRGDFICFKAFWDYLKGLDRNLKKRRQINRKPGIVISDFFLSFRQELVLILNKFKKKTHYGLSW